MNLKEIVESDNIVEKINNNRSLIYKIYIVQYCDAYAHNPDKL